MFALTEHQPSADRPKDPARNSARSSAHPSRNRIFQSSNAVDGAETRRRARQICSGIRSCRKNPVPAAMMTRENHRQAMHVNIMSVNSGRKEIMLRNEQLARTASPRLPPRRHEHQRPTPRKAPRAIVVDGGTASYRWPRVEIVGPCSRCTRFVAPAIDNSLLKLRGTQPDGRL